MALPQPVLGRTWGPQAPDPTTQRDVLAVARKVQAAKRRAEDGGRTQRLQQPPARANSLRRVKDSREQLRTTRARGTSNATTDSTPSTAPGRSFTVANINNGIIYLRPSVRPAHQRARPLPEPIFPQTPPDSATLDSQARPTSDGWEKSVFEARTPTRTDFVLPPLPTEVKTDDDIKLSRPAYLDSSPPPPPHHTRSRSFSTVDEHTVSSQSFEPGTFKVVIDRSGRPKTADTETTPILEVPIPSYRLGTPRFSARGTAILRSSVYTNATATEDYRSSFLTPQRATHSFLSSRTRSDVYSPNSFNFRATMDLRPPLPSSEPSSARISKLPIGPQIYDLLTVNPDDNAVVRFSPNGDILAATPSRLIAHITSPSFLDYELLSDFFLTFRSFLVSRELVAYLLSRLRWAVNRQDDFGRIVRVRTFVALRHWILNYFVDDFVPKYRLRVYFCELVNGLYRDLKAREDGGRGDIKIIGELKKCWRRTCALYWEGDDRIGQDGADEDLQPGGKPGSLASVDENAFTTALPSTPPRDPAPRQVSAQTKPETIGSNPSDQFASKHMDWAHRARHTPQNSLSSPYIPSQVEDGVRVPLSPESERSMQVLSCSIPMRGLNKPEPAKDVPLYAYPVPHPVTAAPSRRTASPQQHSPAKQPNRPSHGHKRSGSFSDALRDNRTHLSFPKSTTSDGDITTVDITTISKIPGSLVRGGLFQPGSPYIDVKNGNLRHTKSRVELAHAELVHPDVQFRGGYVASPGVKKLLGSVRRALSGKQPGSSSPHLASAFQFNHGAPSARSSNPATVSTVASGVVSKRRNTRPRPQVRVDVLASAVAESFKEAVKEQMRNEQQRRSTMPTPALGGFEFEFEKRANSSRGQSPSTKNEDFRLNSGITTGSKSIVIMDDTGAPPVPMMTGALPFSDKEHDLITSVPVGLTRVASIDAKLEDGEKTELHSEHREVEVPQDWQRASRTSIRPSIIPQRRSVSLGRERMHSFRRRGSTKTSMSRPASLRRHTSHASGLGRQQPIESISTFKTMSSDNDPFQFDRQSSIKALKPARQLRRRPGGDLRAAGNVQDLEQGQRPHSTGSVSNRTHSIANSVILKRTDRLNGLTKEPEKEVESESEGELKRKKPLSLVDTHSSQPNLRPSFEAEVAKLAALPDDIDDDGGIESALMKLEGRYEKKSPDLVHTSANTSPRPDVESGAFASPALPIESSNPSYIPSEYDSSQTRSYVKGDDVFHRPLSAPEAEGQQMYRLSGEAFNRRVPPVNSQIESEDSYSSIPLLDRGLSDVGGPARGRASTMDTMRLSAKPAPLKPMSPVSRFGEQSAKLTASSNSSIEHIIKTDSMKRIPADGTMPRSSVARESFLLDDDEDLSDLGSARRTMSNDSHGVRSFFEDETPVGDKDEFLPTHPMRHPPTPPLTANRLNDLPQVDTTVFEKGLPTPGLTPTSRLNGQSFEMLGQSPVFKPQEVKQESPVAEPPHFPFILAYDSETLAQQFTIIEKDALDEIDWRELIELRWKQSSPQISDWVQYLRTQEARGVDVVIARFNLVVKWAVSEIVLTESIEERARCIVKYIHIASHTRRLRNYATMYQLTIALLSNDVSRMRKTWSLVPPAELQTMRELEALVQPLRNFHNLRVEMETATVEEGCIPFIGIYTRDLIYNAQKPAFIDAPPAAGEKLVNFERHHTAATIVKSLLRLLEASSQYTFNVEPNIISKCLWMAALSDDEIAKRSRQHE
ncbi:Guanine nucleotide exchange factor lte1 [Didymosphaeria variabile]|uniref:Guanine nucleotide exchange factor lte1 n=1 Tax=Didymosphaeria variabile TaxID=1932322 RepID=A0A9W8XBP1_9PLEO|nr:Guanine nucleotide exchange factor lte1 [Didymosphaeria variabile]KAJ4346548.1 Guanine nucleotide exchange factor lte1 [Didymosphaeria variabile]